jgi:hypothetical protein
VTAKKAVTAKLAATSEAAELPVRDGYLALPNTIVDELLPRLGTNEQVVYFRLYRLSHGFGRDTCLVGMPALARVCGMSERTVLRTVVNLERLGHIERMGAKHTGENTLRGNVYRIVLPRGVTAKLAVTAKKAVTDNMAVTANLAPNKEDLKESIKSAVYEIRTVAARLFEAHRGAPGFGRDQLRELVRDALIGQGREVVEAQLDEAIGGMAI